MPLAKTSSTSPQEMVEHLVPPPPKQQIQFSIIEPTFFNKEVEKLNFSYRTYPELIFGAEAGAEIEHSYGPRNTGRTRK